MEVLVTVGGKKKKGDGQEKLPTLEQPSDAGLWIGDLASWNAMQQDQDAPISSVDIGKKKKKKTKVNQNEILGSPQAVRFEFHFPEEVWLMILDLVDNKDRTNCSRAFPYLDRILIKSKPVFLAKQVLPFMDKWLSNNDLFNCRKVCRNWCAGVSRLMYSRNTQQVEEFIAEPWYLFSTEGDISRFNQRFSGRTRNPFISSTVCIENSDEDTRFPREVIQLLRRFGKHIRILHIQGFWDLLTPFQWYQFLQEALQNTPRLTQLGIFEEGLSERDEDTENEFNWRLCSYMVQNPIPFIPTLNVLSIKSDGETNQSFQNIHNMMMQPFAGRLKTLSMDMSNWKDQYAAGLLKLVELHMSHVDSGANLARVMLLCHCPLKVLTLNFPTKVSVAVLLGTMKRFPSLEKLSIISNKYKSGQDFLNSTNYNVPAVKSLEIKYIASTSYKFLQRFNSLRRLIVCVQEEKDIHQGADEDEEKRENLTLFKVVKDGKMYESNIWKMIPTLKYVKVFKEYNNSSISGTREGYNEFMEDVNKGVKKDDRQIK